MDAKLDRYQGCLAGMAAGDAMGRPVEKKTIEAIRQSYGPEGLLGYDLMNGKPEVSSYTQICAYSCNALLLAMTQGRTQGLTHYLTLALTQWAGCYGARIPGKPRCWVSHVEPLRFRACTDPQILDTVAQGHFGSVGKPSTRYASPAPLGAAIAAGLYYDPGRMAPGDIGKLGAQSMALTQGNPMAVLSGAVLSYLIAGILQDPDTPLRQQARQAAGVVADQFSAFPQAAQLADMVLEIVQKATRPNMPPQKVMEKLECRSAHTVLLGGVFSALIAQGDFDTALVTAVNHSGCSAGTGAVAGAILGASLGEAALPDFYLDNLDAAHALRQLAQDLIHRSSQGIFDDDWDRKYIQGELVEA